jgi:hypothetical protein
LTGINYTLKYLLWVNTVSQSEPLDGIVDSYKDIRGLGVVSQGMIYIAVLILLRPLGDFWITSTSLLHQSALVLLCISTYAKNIC